MDIIECVNNLARVMEMRWLLLILLGLGGCFLITLIFGLLRAGRRADEEEEKILDIISPTPPDDTTEPEDAPQRERNESLQ